MPIPVIPAVAKPTWMVLITPVVPIPTPDLGWNLISRFDPTNAALYVPSPTSASPVSDVLSCPYSRISISVPL